MKTGTKAAIILAAAAILQAGQISAQQKDSISKRPIITFGQPISEKITQMPVVKITPQQRQWVIDGFLEQLKFIRKESGLDTNLKWNKIMAEGAQTFADSTLASASDKQWWQWGHALGGPMAKHINKYSKQAGVDVISECLTRDWKNENLQQFSINEWKEMGRSAVWAMYLSSAHRPSLLVNTPDIQIGAGFSVHEQKIGNGLGAQTQIVSDFVFWVGFNPIN